MEEIKLRFNTITNKVEPNTYILMDKAGNRIGEINNITEVHLANSMNDANEITFSVYKKLGNKECVYWDSIKDFMLVWVKEWNQIYEIKVKLNDNQDMKSVSLTSLGRAELSQITTSLSVNTEDDIARDDYSPTLIWSDENKDISLLDIVLENAPHYQIIHVDKTIQNLQRTFEFENEFITDAFDEIAKEIDCVFFYSCYFSDGKIKREIYVYDLESNCNNPDCSYLSDKDLNAQGIAYRGQFTGVCPICGSTNISEGYGVDTTICVSKDDLGDEIELEVDTDSVKNCFKLVAGDDVMTSTIKKCNPNGSQYIWDINDETKSRMSDGLRDKLTEYDTLYQNYMTNSITQLETCLQRGFFENRLSDKSITPQEQKEIKQFMENQLATEFNKVNNMAIKINVEGYLFKPYHTDWVSAYNVLASETTRLILKDSTATVTISDDDYNTYMGYIDDYIIKFNTLISIFVAVYNTIIQNYSDYDIYEYKCDHCGYTSTTLTDGKCINCGNSSITKTRRCLKYKIEKPATNYPNLVTQYYNSIDLESLLTDVLMPNAENNENTSAEREIQNLENNLLTIGIDTLKLSNLQLLSANNAVLNMARILISNMYKVEIIQDDNYPSLEVYESYAIWKGTLCVTNYSDENDTCTMSAPTVITIRANDEQSIKERIDYVIKKQKTDKSMDVSNLFTVYEVDNDDSSKNTFKDKTEFFKYFDNELKKYSFNYLVTLKECAQSCVDILTEMQQQQSSIQIVKDSIDRFNEYYTPMLSHIQTEMDKRGKDIVSVQTMQSILETKINEINNKLNMQNFLTESQWIELCSYRREDVYENSNYISDGLGNSEIVANARDFIRKAKEDIYKSSHMQYKISSTLKNFLVIPKFKPLADCFQVGNWIRFKVDGKIYKLRLLSYELDFDNLENMEVTFSDVVNIKDGISDIKSVLDQASSMVSSYDSVQKQVSLNKDVNTVVNRWVDNGFDATLTKIVNTADHQNLVFDEHGLLGRQYDVYTDDYADEQFKLINNGLYITKDNWKTLETALGKIIYQDPLTGEYVADYGLMANVIIGKLIMGNKLVISNDDGTVIIDGKGIKLKGGSIEWINGDYPTLPPSSIEGLNDYLEQLDGRIETYSQTTDPSMNWTTEEYEKHNGDIWVNSETGILKQWNGSTWLTITDSTLKALAESKAQIFTEQPKTPYYIGDLWVQGASGDIMNCISSRISGDFNPDDWSISSKYTNDDVPLGKLADIADDSKITPTEKQQIKSMFADIQASYNAILKQCEEYNIHLSNSSYYNDYDNFKNKFTLLSDIVNSILRDMTTTIEVPSDYESTINNYYDAKKIIITDIEKASKGYVDDVSESKVKEFKNTVYNLLSGGNPSTIIEDDYIISPMIGGGYLYITDKDGNYSIEIDPTKKCDSSTDKYLICVKDRVNNKVIMGVNTSGNGEFSGKVSATQLDLYKDGIKYGQFDIGKMGYPIFGTEEVKGIGIVAENTDGYGRNILFCLREKVEKTNDDGTIYYEEEVVPKAGITPTHEEELIIDARSLHVFHSWVMSHFHSGMLIDGELRVGGKRTLIDGELRVGGMRTVRSFADANNDLHNVFIWWNGTYLVSQVDNTGLGTLFTYGNDNASSCKLIKGSNNMKLKFISYEDGSSYALACTQWIKDNFQSSSSSDYRLKENISSIKNIKDIYLNLKPKQYRFKENCDDNAEKLHFGLIAQEVVSLFEQNGFDADNLDLIERYNTRPYTDEGAYIRDGKAYRINYENLHAYHIRFGQEIYAELTDRCDKLEEENKELKTENEELKNKIDDLEERLTKLEKLFSSSNN